MKAASPDGNLLGALAETLWRMKAGETINEIRQRGPLQKEEAMQEKCDSRDPANGDRCTGTAGHRGEHACGKVTPGGRGYMSSWPRRDIEPGERQAIERIDLVTEATRALTVILRHALGAPPCFEPAGLFVSLASDGRGVHVTLPHFLASPEIVGNLAAFASFCEDAASAEQTLADIAAVVKSSPAELDRFSRIFRIMQERGRL